MYLFVQPAAQNTSTWMKSSVHFRISEGKSFGNVILEGGWRSILSERRIKKKGMAKYASKSICTHSKGANKQSIQTELCPS